METRAWASSSGAGCCRRRSARHAVPLATLHPQSCHAHSYHATHPHKAGFEAATTHVIEAAVFEAILHVVLAIHARGLAHCALQPDSFRLYDGTSWRLVNLESCTPFGEPTPRKCPVCFAPPEVVRHLRAPKTTASAAAIDVWGLGALLWQLYTQQPLFTNENEARLPPCSHPPHTQHTQYTLARTRDHAARLSRAAASAQGRLRRRAGLPPAAQDAPEEARRSDRGCTHLQAQLPGGRRGHGRDGSLLRTDAEGAPLPPLPPQPDAPTRLAPRSITPRAAELGSIDR
eukprot:scaffold70712_cov61-Phaeocystis_antarctica.AAC.4